MVIETTFKNIKPFGKKNNSNVNGKLKAMGNITAITGEYPRNG